MNKNPITDPVAYVNGSGPYRSLDWDKPVGLAPDVNINNVAKQATEKEMKDMEQKELKKKVDILTAQLGTLQMALNSIQRDYDTAKDYLTKNQRLLEKANGWLIMTRDRHNQRNGYKKLVDIYTKQVASVDAQYAAKKKQIQDVEDAILKIGGEKTLYAAKEFVAKKYNDAPQKNEEKNEDPPKIINTTPLVDKIVDTPGTVPGSNLVDGQGKDGKVTKQWIKGVPNKWLAVGGVSVTLMVIGVLFYKWRRK